MQKQRKPVLVIAIVAGAALIYSVLTEPHGVSATYMTEEVIEGRLRDQVSATGSVNAVVTIEVGSQLSGRIVELFVDFNDKVSIGQPVARLDAQTYEARREEASAALEMARANVAIKEAELDRSKAELDDSEARRDVLRARLDGALARYETAQAVWARKKPLSDDNLITSEEVENAELNLKTETAALKEAKAEFDTHGIEVQVARTNVSRQEAALLNARANIPQREALLNLAEVELDRTIIRSPIDGVVIRRNVSEGQTVAASLEAPTLFTIAKDMTEMEIHARVDEADIGRIRLDQRAQFTVDAYPERRFEGVVKQIRKAPEIVRNVVTYTVVIKTNNKEYLLLPGMTADIDLTVMETGTVLKVPRAAVGFIPQHLSEPPEGPMVWVMYEAGQLRPVSIETGAHDRTHIEVSSNSLSVGDQVVTHEIRQQKERRLFGIRIGF